MNDAIAKELRTFPFMQAHLDAFPEHLHIYTVTASLQAILSKAASRSEGTNEQLLKFVSNVMDDIADANHVDRSEYTTFFVAFLDYKDDSPPPFPPRSLREISCSPRN